MKLKKLALIGMVVVATMSACGIQKKDATETQTTAEGESKADADVKRPSDYGTAELGKYVGVEIPNIDTSVSDQDVEEQINTELTQDPDVVEVTDRAVQEGDTVNIDYTGTKDGVAFDGGSATGYNLVIGSNSFIEGFEAGLIGHSIGEDVKLDLTFPKDYNNADLAGAAVVFDVKINSISVSSPATLTDEWVNKHTNGEQKTVDEFKAAVKANLEEQRSKSAKSQDQYNAIAAVIADSKFEMKDEAIDFEYNNIYKPIDNMITQYGMDLDQYASAYGMSADELKTQIRNQAESYVKQVIVTREIYKKEKMSLTDEDYQVVVDLNGGSLTKDELIQQYGKDEVEETAKTYKVVNFILDNAKRTDVTVNINGETMGSEEGASAEGASEETTAEGESKASESAAAEGSEAAQ